MSLRLLRPRRAAVVAALTLAVSAPMTAAYAAPTIAITVVAPPPATSSARVDVPVSVRASDGDSLGATVQAGVTGSWLLDSYDVQGYSCYPDYPCSASLPAGVDVPLVLHLSARAGTGNVHITVTTEDAVQTVADVPLTGLQVAPSLALAAPTAPVPSGSQATLGVTLAGLPASEFAPPVPARLLRRVTGGAFVEVSQTSLVAGAQQLGDVPSETATYVVEVPGDSETAPARSNEVQVAVAVPAQLTVSPVRVPPGSRITVGLTADPLLAGGTFVLERKVGTRWSRLSSGTVSAKAYAKALLMPRAGVAAFRARLTGSARAVPGQAAYAANTLVTLKGLGSAKAYTFLGGSRSRPIRWNPCRPIYYRLNLNGSPTWVVGDTKEALRRVTLVTGIRFVYAGKSRVVVHRDGAGAPRAGSRQEVVIGWYTRKQTEFGSSSAFASTRWIGNHFTGNGIAMPKPTKDTIDGFQGFGAGYTHGALLLHELGHLMGLDHTDSPNQLMQTFLPESLTAATYGAGDIAGLRKLGRAAGCL